MSKVEGLTGGKGTSILNENHSGCWLRPPASQYASYVFPKQWDWLVKSRNTNRNVLDTYLYV